MTNQINQRSKLDQKGKAVTSLVLGFIALISIWLLSLLQELLPQLRKDLVVITYYILFAFISMGGVILGILALKSTKKMLAILGIIFSLISLVILTGILLTGLSFYYT